MKIRIGFRTGLGIIKMFFNPKKVIRSLARAIKGRGELDNLLLFLFGKRECYSGVLLCEDNTVKHALYLKINNGKVSEIGSAKLKSKKPRTALKELCSQLGERGEVSRLISYEKGGKVLFHPN